MLCGIYNGMISTNTKIFSTYPESMHNWIEVEFHVEVRKRDLEGLVWVAEYTNPVKTPNGSPKNIQKYSWGYVSKVIGNIRRAKNPIQ